MMTFHAQGKLKGNHVNIAGEIKHKRFYRKSDFRLSSGVYLLMWGFHRRGHKTFWRCFLKIQLGLMELSSKSYNSSRLYSIFVNFGEPLLR